jgi:hypothetical protein
VLSACRKCRIPVPSPYCCTITVENALLVITIIIISITTTIIISSDSVIVVSVIVITVIVIRVSNGKSRSTTKYHSFADVDCDKYDNDVGVLGSQDKMEAAKVMAKAVHVTNEAAKKVENTITALKKAQVIPTLLCHMGCTWAAVLLSYAGIHVMPSYFFAMKAPRLSRNSVSGINKGGKESGILTTFPLHTHSHTRTDTDASEQVLIMSLHIWQTGLPSAPVTIGSCSDPLRSSGTVNKMEI